MTTSLKSNAGFSLVELVVAAAIFGSVLVFVGGSFSLFVGKQRAQINQQQLQQEIQNLFDILGREVKTAYGETFPVYSGPAESVSFMNQEQKYNATKVESIYQLGSSGGYGKVLMSNDGGINMFALTSDTIDVKSLKFIWSKPETPTTERPYLWGTSTRLTVAIKACVKGDDNSCVIVQDTMASQQLNPLNVP